MLTVNAASGFGSGGGPSYKCDAVVFDGSNDYGVISGAFSGPPADSKLHTTSFWIKLNGDGSTYRIFHTQREVMDFSRKLRLIRCNFHFIVLQMSMFWMFIARRIGLQQTDGLTF